MTMLRRILFCVSMLAGTAAAQSTQPTTVPVDSSTPRGTLKLLATAMDAGDARAIHHVFHASSPIESRMVDAMSDMALALANLRRAATQAYGVDGVRALAGDREAQLADGLSKLDAAHESIDGDHAQVTTDDPESEPVKLVRVDGRWKVPMSDLAPSVDPTIVEQRLTDLAVQINVINKTAREVEAGHYATPQAAGEALRSEMMKVAMQQAATTQSTQPAPAPSTRAR
jgi:hypothetical protein